MNFVMNCVHRHEYLVSHYFCFPESLKTSVQDDKNDKRKGKRRYEPKQSKTDAKKQKMKNSRYMKFSEDKEIKK